MHGSEVKPTHCLRPTRPLAGTGALLADAFQMRSHIREQRPFRVSVIAIRATATSSSTSPPLTPADRPTASMPMTGWPQLLAATLADIVMEQVLVQLKPGAAFMAGTTRGRTRALR